MQPKSTHRYAKAFFELCQDKGSLEIVRQDLLNLQALLEQTAELKFFFANQIVGYEKQSQIINELFAKKLNLDTFNFLLFIAHRKKLYLFSAMSDEWLKLYAQLKEVLEVQISSAVLLKKEQVQAISERLKKAFTKTVEAKCLVAPELLGGFKVQVKDVIFDFSIKDLLRRYKLSVMNAY